MSYRVFARKYRPQTFDEVVGQGHITRTLANAIAQNRLAQAYLFVGPRGIGKTSTARILAKALNCQKGPTITPCGVCDACREIAEGNSLDVLEIDGASNNSVEHVRELRENAAYAPARGPYKIYLVDEVHMLSTAAFNALLKTLEEPPPHVKFIFATTEAQKVPATITSRCQRFDLRRIPADLIAAHLQFIATQEKVALEPAAAEAVAKGADGGLRDAESMLDQLVAFCGETITAEDVFTVFGFTSAETVESLATAIFAKDAAAALALVAEQAAAGKDLARLMGDMITHLRDLLVRSVQPGADVPVPRERLLTLLDHFSEAEGRLRWATDKRLYFDVAVIKAVHLLDEANLTEVIDTLVAIGGGHALPERPKATVPTPAPLPKAAPAPAPVARPEPVAPPAAVEPSKPAPAPKVEPPKPAAEAPPWAVEPSKVVESPKSAIAEEEPLPVVPTASGGEAIWREVAATLNAESPIRFAWLLRGEFAGSAPGKFRVRFPVSDQGESESLFWDDVRKHTEALLTEKLGEKVELGCEFTIEIAETAEPSAEELAAATAEVEEVPAAPATDPMEDFKNDPLIRRALEIFNGKIQTT